MENMIFVVFNKREGEITNAYSLVTKETFTTIPQNIIHKTKEVENKLYSKEEFEALRDSLLI